MAAMTLFGCGKKSDILTLLVGTYTDTDSKGIYTFKFDQATGESTPLAITDIPNPSFLAVAPGNNSRLTPPCRPSTLMPPREHLLSVTSS